MYVELGRFGGRSLKGTWLYSNYGFLKDRAGANIVCARVCVQSACAVHLMANCEVVATKIS
eukprot:781070-Alexandrium_andersonii.AAC.1